MGSRICSLLCGASPPPGDRSGESLRLFHLRWIRERRVRRSKGRSNRILKNCRVTLTFVYIGRQPADEHFAREALDPLPVLVGVAVGGAQDARDALVAVSVVEEIVIDGEERRASCWGKQQSSLNRHFVWRNNANTHAEAQIKQPPHTHTRTDKQTSKHGY